MSFVKRACGTTSPKSDVLIVAPEFEGEWINTYSKVVDIVFYDESTLLRDGFYLKGLQAICYLIDMVLPRRLAVSGLFRLFRVDSTKCKMLYSQLDALASNYNKVFLIKAFGAREEYFSQGNHEKLKLILWDSIARYSIYKSMRKFLLATTSVFDAEKAGVPVLVFSAPDLNSNVQEPLGSSALVFVGRFSIIRFVKCLCLSIFFRDFEAYLGVAPFVLNVFSVHLEKGFVDYSGNGRLVVLGDLNEDSPSFRIDGVGVLGGVTDIQETSSLFPEKDVLIISYFPPKVTVCEVKKEINRLYLMDLVQ